MSFTIPFSAALAKGSNQKLLEERLAVLMQLQGNVAQSAFWLYKMVLNKWEINGSRKSSLVWKDDVTRSELAFTTGQKSEVSNDINDLMKCYHPDAGSPSLF
jgi:hypothetical protein